MSAVSSFSLRRIFVAAYAPAFLSGIAEGAILPVVALGVRERGGSVALAALALTLLGIGSLLTNLPASLLTHRYGERTALVAASVWGAVGLAIAGLVPGLGLFAAGVFMFGMASAVVNLARQSYLTAAVPFHFRARAFSLMGGVSRIGLFIGPFLTAAAIAAGGGLAGAYAVAVVAIVVSAVTAARLPALPALDDDEDGAPAAARAAPSLLAMARTHRRVFATIGVGVLLVAAVRAARQVVIPLWADHIGLDAATTSLVYGLANGVDMLVFYPAGKLMDRRGRAAVAVPSMLVMGAALAAVPFTSAFATLLAASLAIGFGNGISSGIIMTLGADQSPSVGRAHFLGYWRLIADIGAAGSPALLSSVTAAVSLAAGVWATAALGIVAAVLLARWIPRTTPPARGFPP